MSRTTEFTSVFSPREAVEPQKPSQVLAPIVLLDTAVVFERCGPGERPHRKKKPSGERASMLRLSGLSYGFVRPGTISHVPVYHSLLLQV